MKRTQFPKWGEGYNLSLVLNESRFSGNGRGKELNVMPSSQWREQDIKKQNGEKLRKISREMEGTSQKGEGGKHRRVI